MKCVVVKNYNHGDNMTEKSRPIFSKMLDNFKKVYGDGSLKHVADVIGGKVAVNIEMGIKDPNTGFTNGCAIRMSYALNYSENNITRGIWNTVSGADKKWYIYRVQDLINYLTQNFGSADKVIKHPKSENFSNMQGIIVFQVDWKDATGHASLWNGENCSDHCYFDKASEASIWFLK